MLKEAIEKIQQLCDTKLLHVGGIDYMAWGDGNYREIRPDPDVVEEIRLTSLDALVKFVRTEAVKRHSMPYEFKVRYAAIRAREFVQECEKRDLNYHVSVGGLDSITLSTTGIRS